MIKFDCQKLGDYMEMYIKKYNLTNIEFCRITGIQNNSFYKMRAGYRIPWARTMQEYLDKLGCRLIVDGKEFRLDNHDPYLKAIANRKGLNIRTVAECSGCRYNNQHLSVYNIQYILEEMGLNMYIEEIAG